MRTESVQSFRDPLWGVAGFTLIAIAGFYLKINLATESVVCLTLVVFIAVRFGFWIAAIASILVVASLNYFFVQPIFSFLVDEPRNWIALGAFQVTALVVSRLSFRVQEEADRAKRQQRESASLYAISQFVLIMNPSHDPGPALTEQVRKVFRLDAVVLFDAIGSDTHASGPASVELEAQTRDAYQQDRDHDGEGVVIRVLRVGGRPIGSIGLSGPSFSPIVANPLAYLVAIALERAKSFERESHAIAGREAEQLRGAVLDALGHDLKTPLTAIQTASFGLLETAVLPPEQYELLSLIDEEVKRIIGLTDRLLKTARLESSQVVLQREIVPLSQVVNEAIREMGSALSDHPVDVTADDSPALYADKGLLKAALLQVLDNAAKFGTPHSPVSVRIECTAGEIILSVKNEGSFVPTGDRGRVFDRFYRSSATWHSATGTGLGLSITKKIVEAHEGRTWVESDENSGTVVFLALPRYRGIHG